MEKISASQKEVIIDGDEAKHIIKVLRKREGDIIDIFDGKGNEYSARIKQIKRNPLSLKVEIMSQKTPCREPEIKIYLYQGILKGEKMDFVIQKCTEIGVLRVVPIITERTISRPQNKKTQRWQKIAINAAKQSGREIIPKIGEIMVFTEAINEFKSQKSSSINRQSKILGLIPWESEQKTSLKDVLQKYLTSDIWHLTSVFLFIGPEGGFTKEEISVAKKSGFIPISLGKRILRSETASLVTSSLILYESGDL